MKKILFVSLLFFSGFGAWCQNQDTASLPNRPRITQYMETSRQVEHIQANYPYDISLRTAAGDTLNTATVFQKNGKPTVLMFWLTTCVPCGHELAAISANYETWKETADFNLYAISIDFSFNYEQFVKRVKESGWPFPAYLDMNREFGLIMPGKLNGLPQTFILDKDGNIAHHKRRYLPGDEKELFEIVKSLQ